MKKNVASQSIGVQMITAADGTAFTGATTVYVTGDAGTQAIGSVGSGACAHEGNGFHTYAPAQAETNYNHIAFTFIGTGAIPVTVQLYTEFPQTGDAFDRLGAPAGASIAADLVVIDNFVDDLETRLSAARAGYLDNLSAGAAALEATAQSILTDTGTTLETHLTDIKGATFSGATDSLEAIRNRGDAAWTTASAPSAASIADAVWDEAIAGHLVAGSTGEALNAAGAAGDPWTTTLPGAYGAGSAGYIIGTNINATISSRASQTSLDTVDGIVDNILIDTAEIGAAGAGLTALASAADLATAISYIDTEVTAIYNIVAHATYGNAALRTRGDAAWTTATGFSIHAAADIWAVATRALTDKTGFSLAADQAVNATKINGSATAAERLALSAATFVSGSAVAGTLSTTEMTTDLTEATDDHFNGRIIIWTSGVLKDQATDITDHDGATKKLIYTATTEAPSAGDTFIVV